VTDTHKSEDGLAARLLHGAKDFIWQSDPAQDGGNTVPRAGNRNSASSNANVSVAPSASTPTATAIPANSMGAELLAVVMGRPTAYSALTESIAALSDIPMDEATRYRSAFAVLRRTQSRSLEQVVQAVDVHMGLLDAEIARFKGQSKTAEDGEITARVAEVAAINTALTSVNQQIDQLRAQTDARIAQLQDELVQKQARAAELTREAEQKKNAIQQTQQNFEAAIALVQNTLVADKTKLLQYLG
jgi:hypothetical protein